VPFLHTIDRRSALQCRRHALPFTFRVLPVLLATSVGVLLSQGQLRDPGPAVLVVTNANVVDAISAQVIHGATVTVWAEVRGPDNVRRVCGPWSIVA
jgi:hypothetical protein